MSNHLKHSVPFILLLPLILIQCAHIPFSSEAPEESGVRFMVEDGITLFHDPDWGLTIIQFRENFDFHYDPARSYSLDELGKQHPYRYLVNGSFFEGGYAHAGFLSMDTVLVTPWKNDRQLTHIAIMDLAANTLSFVPSDSANTPNPAPHTICFQTGPLVIDKNVVDTLSIQASINGTGAHLRTLVGFAEPDLKYLIITRKPVHLDDLGHYLLALPMFYQRTLSVVNLDGGSSVAFFSREHPELNFGERKRLPILFGVR